MQHDPTAYALRERIRAEREAAGLTQGQAAGKAGWACHRHWSQLERGARTPRVDTLAAMGEVFGLRLTLTEFTDEELDALRALARWFGEGWPGTMPDALRSAIEKINGRHDGR